MVDDFEIKEKDVFVFGINSTTIDFIIESNFWQGAGVALDRKIRTSQYS